MFTPPFAAFARKEKKYIMIFHWTKIAWHLIYADRFYLYIPAKNQIDFSYLSMKIEGLYRILWGFMSNVKVTSRRPFFPSLAVVVMENGVKLLYENGLTTIHKKDLMTKK